jgi:cell division protein FtsI (penicillin-binding protein 3)
LAPNAKDFEANVQGLSDSLAILLIKQEIITKKELRLIKANKTFCFWENLSYTDYVRIKVFLF